MRHWGKEMNSPSSSPRISQSTKMTDKSSDNNNRFGLQWRHEETSRDYGGSERGGYYLMVVIRWVTQRRWFYMECRKIMRNVLGGVDRAGHFRHGRGSRCTKTHVHAAPGNLAWLEMGKWRLAWLEVGNSQTWNYFGKAGSWLESTHNRDHTMFNYSLFSPWCIFSKCFFS